MKVLDIQRKGQQIGRLRIGQQVATGQNDRNGNPKMRPARLDTFRFTTGSRYVAESVAVAYGGQVVPWDRGQFEVITAESALFVTIPPRDDIISQSYEMWTGGGCVRRCDSQREQISGGQCLCPHAEDTTNPDEVAEAAAQRSELAKANPPKACKLITRISVMLPDLPGLGVWRLDTHSFYAAVEIGDQAELMHRAREHDVLLRAVLRIDHRERVAGGQTKKFPVPVLEIVDTFRDLVTGAIAARPVAEQLPPTPGRLALTAGTGQSAPQPAAAPQVTAQDIADRAARATTRAEITALAKEAEQLGVAGDYVCTDEVSDLHEELTEYLRAEYGKRPAPPAPASRRSTRPAAQEQATLDPDHPGPTAPGGQADLGWPEQ